MKTAILGLHAETSIHAGAGSALDVIDLPIQREAHSNWPCIFGSAMKGALRSAAETNKGAIVELVFGPRDGNNNAYAGALLVGDARLLLLPVRSLTSHFKWVTCPAVLQRLKRDVERLEIKLDLPAIPVEPAEMSVWAQMAGDLFLEEYKFSVNKLDSLESWATKLAQLSAVAEFAQDLPKQLVIVRNDDFAHLVKHATPITPHIALESSTKSVKAGALWYEETLPPETVLYVCLAANDARQKDSKFSAEQVMDSVADLFKTRPYLQVGGNETVGMGWCKIKIVDEVVK